MKQVIALAPVAVLALVAGADLAQAPAQVGSAPPPSITATQTAPPSGGAYNPAFVRLDGGLPTPAWFGVVGAALSTSGGPIADSSHMTMVMNFRGNQWTGGGPAGNLNYPATADNGKLIGNLGTAATHFEGTQGQYNTWDNAGGQWGTGRWAVGSSANTWGAGGATSACEAVASAPNFRLASATPHQVIFSFDGSSTAGQRKNVAVYYDGQLVAQGCNAPSAYAAAAFVANWSNAMGWSINGPGYAPGAGGDAFISSEVGDIFLDFTQSIVCTGAGSITINGAPHACSAANTIPADILADLWNSATGTPTNYIGFESADTCSLLLGRTPEICLSAAATPGTLTQYGAVANLSGTGVGAAPPWNPITTPHSNPFVSWAYGEFVAASTPSLLLDVGSTGGGIAAPIRAGDLLIVAFTGANSSAPFSAAANCASIDFADGSGADSTTPAGFTLISTSRGSALENPVSIDPGGRPLTFTACYKIATAADASNVYGYFWTGLPPVTRQASWSMADYQNVNASTPFEQVMINVTCTAGGCPSIATTGSSVSTPGYTTTTGYDTLVSIAARYFGRSNSGNMPLPSGQNRRLSNTPPNSAGTQISDYALGGPGASAPPSAYGLGPGTNDGIVMSLYLESANP